MNKIKGTFSKDSDSTSKGFKSLFSKIITFVGGPVILAFLVVSLILLKLVNSAVTNLTTNELSAKSQSAANEVEYYFDKNLEIVKQLSMISQMEPMFTEIQGDMRINEHKDFPAIKRTLENIQEANKDSILNVWIGDVDSSQFAQADGYLSDSSWNIQARALFQQLNGAKTAILTEPYEDTATKLQIVTAVAPVFKPGTQEIIGVAGVDFSLEALGEKIGSYSLGKNGFYILTTGLGQIIYHPVAENINRNISAIDMSENIKKAMLSKTEGSIEYTSHNVHSYGYVASVGNTGWMIATGLPDAEFLLEFYSVRNTIITTFIIVISSIIIILLVMSRHVVAPIKTLTKIAHMIADGNLEVSAQVTTHDETGQMANAINRTVVQLNRYNAYIKEITSTLETMAQGDMRIDLKEDYIGEFASIRTAFTDLASSLNYTLHTIDTAAEQVATGSEQVSGGAQALSAGSTEQAASVEELSASVEKIAEQAAENTATVTVASQSVKQAVKGVEVGNEHMEQLTRAMADISSDSNQIAEIAKSIEDIAFQTNILALNAAIEAARAGAAGKGFGVVSDEVRTLATKSTEAAKKAGELIAASVSSVSKGMEITERTAKILKDVGTSTLEVTSGFEKIELATAEQSSAIEQVKQGLSQISSVVQTNAATAEENSATSEEMSAQAAALHQEVRKFKLTESEKTSLYGNNEEANTDFLGKLNPLDIKPIKKDKSGYGRSDFGKY